MCCACFLLELFSQFYELLFQLFISKPKNILDIQDTCVKHRTFQNYGGHCAVGNLQCSIFLLLPFPDLCLAIILWASELCRQSLWPHGHRFVIQSALSAVRPPIECVSLNLVQSISFTAGGLQSSCRIISATIKGSVRHLSCSLITRPTAIQLTLTNISVTFRYHK